MEKERILVCDNKRFFLKMFKRKFEKEFDFFESSFFIENDNEPQEFDRFIYVIYDKSELIDFLKLEKKGSNILVCLFDKQLHRSLSFLEESKSLILLDSTKTRTEIIKELKLHFKKKSVSGAQISETKSSGSNIISTPFNSLYKALFFLM